MIRPTELLEANSVQRKGEVVVLDWTFVTEAEISESEGFLVQINALRSRKKKAVLRTEGDLDPADFNYGREMVEREAVSQD